MTVLAIIPQLVWLGSFRNRSITATIMMKFVQDQVNYNDITAFDENCLG